MQKIEITKLSPVSTFKTVMYFLAIPIALMVIIGGIMILVGILLKEYEIIFFGAILALGYPVMFVVLYGPITMLNALIYNFLAGKFGGLEITVKDFGEE